MSKHIVATSLNGKEVYAYLMQQPLSAAISRNPHLLALIKEAVSTLNLTQQDILLEQNMGRNIGYGEMIATREKDTIFYARLVREETYTKFVKNRKTEPTPFLTLNLRKDDDGNYEIKDVWIGKTFPPVPGNAAETEQSKSYWEDHAVAFNGQAIMASTITKECPF